MKYLTLVCSRHLLRARFTFAGLLVKEFLWGGVPESKSQLSEQLVLRLLGTYLYSVKSIVGIINRNKQNKQ